MKPNRNNLFLIGVFLALVLAAGVVWQKSVQRSVSKERKPLYYQDSMHPWIKSDRPGKCTVCEMDLTPIYEGQRGFGGDNFVAIGTNQVTVLNVQTEPVKRLSLSRSLRVAGTLDANETRKAIISAPARGRIDNLAVEYAGVEVKEGQKLITMFSPELVQLRKTLLAVRDLSQAGATNAISKALVDSGIYTGDILAPQSGVVLERNVYSGQYVAEGDRLLVIADASTLWFRFDVYQDQLPWFGLGEPLEVEVSGIPGKVFPAVISFVEPNLNEATRTVKVRADIQNPLLDVNGRKQRLLKYGMYAEGRVRAEVPDVLALPRTAVLHPGGGAYVYVDKGDGAYERRRLKLGRQGDEFYEVLEGVEEGDNVVTAGNVLIDAQAQFNRAGKTEAASGDEKDTAEPTASQGATAGGPLHIVTAPRATESGAMSEASPPAVPMGTNRLARTPSAEHAAAKRTQKMSAIMSPGAELQMRRRATILEELGAKGITNVAQPTADKSSMSATDSSMTGTASNDVQAATEGPLPVRVPPSQFQYQQVQSLLLEADAISASLAADNLEQYKAHVARFPTLLAPVQNELAVSLQWEKKLMEPLAALAKGEPPKDLEEARRRFLPFSTGVVALVKQVKQDLTGFPKLFVFHCPMAPKPGLWMQTSPPLRNPFFGSKMLSCGEEVKQ